MNPVAIFDIETQGWDQFVLGVIYWPGTKEHKAFRWDKGRGEKKMAETLLGIKGEIAAHNLGRFDGLWFLDAMQEHGLIRPCDVVATGQGIVQLKVGEAVFVDSLKVYPMSLAKLTNGAKDNLAALCKCGNDCGGYCAIRRDASKKTLEKIEQYCYQDCRSLSDALNHMRGVAEESGLVLGLTLGSTAWKSARDELKLPPMKLDKADWKRVRDGYYGGRVEVFQTEAAKGFVCDVNSMYPWALAETPLPVDFRGCEVGQAALLEWRKGYPGIFRAEVSVPFDMWIPPLPARLPNGIAFPVGRFTGDWTRLELEYAISLGVKLISVLESSTFNRTEKIFGPWVNRLFDVRLKYGKKSREGEWVKLILNSLTGKFGSRNEIRSIKLWPILQDLRICECDDAFECDCGCYGPLDIKGRVWEALLQRRDLEPCAHAEWAAYLTSAARIKLHRKLIEGGKRDAVYCDTDSVFSIHKRPKNVGTALGTWEYQGPFVDFECLGPKTYHVTIGEKEITKAKGISKPVWDKLKNGFPNPYHGVRGLRRAKKGERFFESMASERIVTPNTGQRVPGPGGLTMPPRALDIGLE